MQVLDKNANPINANECEILIDCNAFNANQVFEGKSIGINFPSHSDGRGFSIARVLRNRGFNGKLRAIGPLIPDQFADLIACGFDEIEIPDEQLNRQKIHDWVNAKNAYSIAYQRKNARAKSIIELRHGAQNDK